MRIPRYTSPSPSPSPAFVFVFAPAPAPQTKPKTNTNIRNQKPNRSRITTRTFTLALVLAATFCCRLQMVVFDDFAQWYTDGGYEVAPWLELLDLSKWVLAKS